jgi:hypothetical protein
MERKTGVSITVASGERPYSTAPSHRVAGTTVLLQRRLASRDVPSLLFPHDIVS